MSTGPEFVEPPLQRSGPTTPAGRQGQAAAKGADPASPAAVEGATDDGVGEPGSEPLDGEQLRGAVEAILGGTLEARAAHEAEGAGASASRVLELAGVSRRGLYGVNLSLHSGEVLGIAGLGGSGKSLLGRLIAGRESFAYDGAMTLGARDAKAIGARRLSILFGVVIPEALAPLILGYTFMFIAVVDMSAMAGYIGGGGLGNFAIIYGYQQFDQGATWVTVAIIVVIVQVGQFIGNRLAQRILRR